MWRATTDDEANFIFDLNNAPDPSEPALQYAQWLEGRGKPLAAEFLRRSLLPRENQPRLKVLRKTLDARWVNIVSRGWYRPGDLVRITAGPFAGIDGTVHGVDGSGGCVHLMLNIIGACFPPVHELDLADVQLLKRARHRDNPEAPS